MTDLDALINELGLDFDEKELRESAVYAARSAFVTVVDRLLHNQGWNRTRLAKEMGLTRSRISQILSENSDVTFSDVAAILFCLGIDMSNVLHQAAKPQASSWSFDSNAQKSIPKVTHPQAN